jgi:hypothetical protein
LDPAAGPVSRPAYTPGARPSLIERKLKGDNSSQK